MITNLPTEEGRALGKELARLCDSALLGKPDERCATCAFRLGTEANGSPATLMDATKCVLERVPFFCHEHARPCAGFAAMVLTRPVVAPWEFVGGSDSPAP